MRMLELCYRPKNCDELWQKFHSAFAYKAACDFDIHSYDDFIRAARHNISTLNKVGVFLIIIDLHLQY